MKKRNYLTIAIFTIVLFCSKASFGQSHFIVCQGNCDNMKYYLIEVPTIYIYHHVFTNHNESVAYVQTMLGSFIGNPFTYCEGYACEREKNYTRTLKKDTPVEQYIHTEESGYYGTYAEASIDW